MPGTRLYVDFVEARRPAAFGVRRGAARLHTKSTYRRVPGAFQALVAWNASIH